MDASELELVPWVHTTTVIKHSGTTNRLGSCPMRFVRFVCLFARYFTVALDFKERGRAVCGSHGPRTWEEKEKIRLRRGRAGETRCRDEMYEVKRGGKSLLDFEFFYHQHRPGTFNFSSSGVLLIAKLLIRILGTVLMNRWVAVYPVVGLFFFSVVRVGGGGSKQEFRREFDGGVSVKDRSQA